ncbi:MAG: sialate O-acetylesterase, partial [Planctomycetota bacterium]
MEIHAGLFAHGVLQRDGQGRSDTVVRGVCRAAGPVYARVRRGSKSLPGFDRSIGAANDGAFHAKLKGIPVGGPYIVELFIAGPGGPDGKPAERLRVEDIYVGDLWILAGQSNMQGIGWMEFALKPMKSVQAFFMNDRWAPAKDPVHNLWDAVDSVHATIRATRPQKAPHQGVGPGVAFGQAMAKRTRVPQGLIASAHGGTSMPEWDPAKLPEAGNSLYGAAIRRARKNGGRVAGIVWYQGESDANPAASGLYTDRMATLVAAFRRDLEDPQLPFVLVQLGRFVTSGSATHWNSVQEQQRLLPRRIRRVATVPAIDLGLDDGIHIGGRGQAVLGARLAEAMDVLIRGKRAARPGGASLPPIELRDIAIRRHRILGTAELVVRFANVKGKLTADGEPHGFSLAGGGGVIQTRLEGNRAHVLTWLPVPDAASQQLFFGQGFLPVCNIHDAAGRSLPVFGPATLGQPRAATPFVNCLEVSPLLPSAGNLDGLKYPADMQALLLKPRQFAGSFCDVHLEVG